MTDTNTRLTELEIQSTHMANTIDELSAVIASQAGEIETLTRRLHMLLERAAREDVDGGESAPLTEQVPPHW